MQIQNARNPKYVESGMIDIEIEHPTYGWLPFTASPDDSETLGRELHAAALAGKFGAISAYIAPIPTAEEQKAVIQAQIDSLERQQLMPRITREALLGIILQQSIVPGLTESQLYATDINYRKLKDLDVSIVALRDQLVAVT